MSKKRIKQYLMLLTVVGLVAIAAGGGNGTFASFNAEVTNAGNTFAAGTLFLHDNGGTTTCTSESSSDNLSTNNCDVLFNNIDLSSAAGSTAHLTLSNAGTIPASDIKWDVSSCSVGDNFANTGVHTTFGSAPTCGQMYVTIQETGSSFLPAGNVYCAAGTDSSGTCQAPSAAVNLGNVTSLTNLLTTGGATATFTAAGGAKDTRYYVIKVVPGGVTNDNSLQNRAVTFAMTWHIDQ